MRRFESLSCAIPLGAMLFLLAGCGGSQHNPQEKYYLLSSNIKIPYWETAANGLMRAARQMQVPAELVGPDTYDAQAQQQELRRLVGLQQKPAGILISPADANLMKADIDAAIAAGIPVITLDSDAPSSKRLLFIGTNNYQAGVMGGRVLAKQLQGKGNVVVFTMPGQANLAERLNGYRFALGEHPGFKIDVVDIKGDPRVAFIRPTKLSRSAVTRWMASYASKRRQARKWLRCWIAPKLPGRPS